MPGRTFTSTSQYRYGFNGKETDSETSTQDYGMRIYNPSLGRFLSVDPLFAEYPFNSTYAFAENSPIANIDLDGAEKLNVAISSEPLDGKAGKATITITLDYIVVTKGAGAMTAAMVDAGDFSARYTKGNTTLYLTKLPTKTNQAEEAKFSDK